MPATPSTPPLALSTALTAKTAQLSLGLESGAADLLELVTPTTAELLHWWFGQDMVDARGGLNFHAGQKQALLNAIVAHEAEHARQWRLLGTRFPQLYLEAGVNPCTNLFERTAGLAAGGYVC